MKLYIFLFCALISSCNAPLGLTMLKPVEIRYSALGDSITFGKGSSNLCSPKTPALIPESCKDAKNWPVLFAAKISEGKLLRYQNLADSGNFLSDVIRFQVPKLQPDVNLITIFIGTNDLFRICRLSMESKEKGDLELNNFALIFDQLIIHLKKVHPAAKIILINIGDASQITYYFKRLDQEIAKVRSNQVRQIIEQLKNKGLIYVDFYNDSFPYNPTYFPDGLHPNDLGSKMIADEVLKKFQSNKNQWSSTGKK